MDEDVLITSHQRGFFPSASSAPLARRAAAEIQGDTEVPESKGIFHKQGTKTNVSLQIPTAPHQADSHRRAGCKETSSLGGEKTGIRSFQLLPGSILLGRGGNAGQAAIPASGQIYL